MDLLSEELKSALTNHSYKLHCEQLQKKVTQLETRIATLEAALEIYRKDVIRGTTEEIVG